MYTKSILKGTVYCYLTKGILKYNYTQIRIVKGKIYVHVIV